MPNKQVIFTDRIVGLTIQNGLVRMDLAVVAGAGKTKDDKPALKMEVTHQLVMPMEAFLAGVNAQQGLIKRVIERQEKTKGKGAAGETTAENA